MQHTTLTASTDALALDLFLSTVAQGSLSGFLKIALENGTAVRLVIRNGGLLHASKREEGTEPHPRDERRLDALAAALTGSGIYCWEAVAAEDIEADGPNGMNLMAALLNCAKACDDFARAQEIAA